MPVLRKREWTKEENLALVKAFESSQIGIGLDLINQISSWNETLRLNLLRPYFQMGEAIKTLMDTLTYSSQVLANFGVNPHSITSLSAPSRADFPPHYAYPQYNELEDLEHIPDTFGFTITPEGRFMHNGTLLKHITLNSKHGRYFQMFLTEGDNYVKNKYALNELGHKDMRNLGFIKRDMIAALNKDGFEPEFFRSAGQGYRLLSVERLLN